MAIFAQPSASFVTTCENAPTGLVGTIGVRLTRPDGTAAIARTTAGIVEVVAGSGFYRAALTAPSTSGRYLPQWDTGSVSPQTLACDDTLVVSSWAGVNGEPTDVPVSSRMAA